MNYLCYNYLPIPSKSVLSTLGPQFAPTKRSKTATVIDLKNIFAVLEIYCAITLSKLAYIGRLSGDKKMFQILKQYIILK